MPGIKLTNGTIIDYRTQTSLRARNLRLKLSARDGLTVVLPPAFDLKCLPSILETKRNWIEANIKRFAEAARVITETPTDALPDAIELKALEETWRVEYRLTKAQTVGVTVDKPWRIIVSGIIDNRIACRQALIRWLRLRTREEFTPWLARLAEQNGFMYSRIMIKGQKTRWGSCSSKKIINLNYKLLFLPRDFVRHVLLHELCHTVALRHSSHFWTLLRGLEPEFEVLRKQMREAWKYLPAWLYLT